MAHFKSTTRSSAPKVLRKRQSLVLDDAEGTIFAVDKGCLWVTLERDWRDLILVPGMRFEIDRRGRTVVAAEEDSRFRLLAQLTFRDRLAAGLEPKRVSFNFEYTDMWDQARFMAGELAADGTTVVVDALLEELRLDGPTYTRIRQGALARALAVNEAQRQCMTANEERVLATAEDFRTERGLLTSADADRWMKEHHVGPEQWTRLMEDEARLRWVH